MMRPSQSDDTYDTYLKRYEPSGDEYDLVQALSSLSESDIAAVLKRLNINIVKQEACKRDQDADKAETTDESPTRFSHAMTSNVLPSPYMKVSTGLMLRLVFCTGVNLATSKRHPKNTSWQKTSQSSEN